MTTGYRWAYKVHDGISGFDAGGGKLFRLRAYVSGVKWDRF